MIVITLQRPLRKSFENPSRLLGDYWLIPRRTPEELSKSSRRILEATRNQYRLKLEVIHKKGLCHLVSFSYYATAHLPLSYRSNDLFKLAMP